MKQYELRMVVIQGCNCLFGKPVGLWIVNEEEHFLRNCSFRCMLAEFLDETFWVEDGDFPEI